MHFHLQKNSKKDARQKSRAKPQLFALTALSCGFKKNYSLTLLLYQFFPYTLELFFLNYLLSLNSQMDYQVLRSEHR